MTLDDRRLSRSIHLLAIASAVAALSMILPAMGRIMGDGFTVGTSLSFAAVFVGLPTLIGINSWSNRTAPRTPVMSAYLVLCGLLAGCTLAVSLRMAVAGGPAPLLYPFATLGVSIALAVAAAFVRDRRHGAVLV